VNKKNASLSSDCVQRVASVVTTSALSLTLLGCVDPSYINNNPGPQTGGGFSAPPNTGVGQAQFSDQQAYNKYFANGYNYIDAKVLANYWGESSPSDAKLRMGRKMLNFGIQEGRANINPARSYATRGDFSNWPVFYSDGGYSFEDAEAVGAYWGGDVVHGKMKLARNLIQGQDDWNRSALAAAR
jgi:hypothetical protein